MNPGPSPVRIPASDVFGSVVDRHGRIGPEVQAL
jgi:hypothetical protein